VLDGLPVLDPEEVKVPDVHRLARRRDPDEVAGMENRITIAYRSPLAKICSGIRDAWEKALFM
jgi:hypothetical protein